MADYYETLGVSRNASPEELKKAYRKLSMALHPDRQTGKSDAEKKEAEEKFKAVNAAYACLSNPDKRAHYDQFGEEDQNGFNGFGGGGFDPMEFFRKMHENFAFGDNDDSMFSHFGFDSSMHAHSSSPKVGLPEDGKHIQILIKLSFKEAIFGTTKRLNISLTKECPHCNGTGVENGTKPETCNTCHGTGRATKTIRHGFMIQQFITDCPDCNGVGAKICYCKHCKGQRRIEDKKCLDINIPQGIDNGQRIRIVGKGHCGVCGGKAGNLYIDIEVEESKLFKRDGKDLYMTYSVDPITASLGGELQIYTPYGKEAITIKPLVSSKTVMKLAGKGVKTPNGTGDLLLQILVEPISNATAEQKELLEKLRSTLKSSNLKELSTYNSLVEKELNKSS